MKATGKKFELVFVSSDKDQKSFDGYFADMPWLALPFADRARKEKLSKKFKVQGIPTLVVADAKTGKVITTDGRTAVSEDPTGSNFPWIPPTFAEAFGTTFVGQKGQKFGLDHLKGKTVGLYFSAHWCPPCKRFTPKLASLYKALKAKHQFEVIFCSSDKDQGAFDSYFGEMPWLAIPYSDRKRKADLSSHFKVEGIPTLVILEGVGGDSMKVITTDGTSVVTDDEAETIADFPWYPKPVKTIDMAASSLNSTAGIICFVKDAAEQKAVSGRLTPFAEAFNAKAGSDEDASVMFVTCLLSHQLAPRLKQLTKSGDATVVMIDIPQGGSFHSKLTATSPDLAAGLKTFLADYQAGKLTKVPMQ